MPGKTRIQRDRDRAHVRTYVKSAAERKGVKLAENQLDRAASHGEKVWNGRTGVGEAAEAGLLHVTED